jgi:hypothetical protein
LCFDGILRGAEKCLDTQVLFDPFEKQFHLPATFVKLSDGQSRKLKIVGEEPKAPVVLFVIENDVTQILWIVVGRFDACKPNGLITAYMSAARMPCTNTDQEAKMFW